MSHLNLAGQGPAMSSPQPVDAAAEPVIGTMWNDYNSGTASADTIVGWGGDDNVHYSDPAWLAGDVIDGSVGIDTLGLDFTESTRGIRFTVADSASPIALLGGVVIDIEAYSIQGSNLADQVTGGRWDDHIEGHGGIDRLDGGLGDDALFGGAANDVLTGGNGADGLLGGDGNDKAGGGNGNDQIWGDAGNDTLTGDAGNDGIYGGIGNDSADGGTGNDSVFGLEGDDRLNGGIGDDSIDAGYGNDTVNGGAGNDSIEMWSFEGADSIDGGDGIDRLKFDGLSGTFIAKAPNLVNTLPNGTQFINIEAYSLTGSTGRDAFTGHDGDDVMTSYDGNDVLNGKGGRDQLDAGTGTDKVDGGTGDDILIVRGGGRDTVTGGVGIDTATVDRSGFSSEIDYTFTLTGTTGRLSDGTLINTVEHFDIRTAYGNDTLTAGAALSARFDAAGGNNRLIGGDGDDFLTSGSGNDTHTGGKGRDVVIDGGGINTIDVGEGDDEVRVETYGSGQSTIDLGDGDDWVLLNNAGGRTAGNYTVEGGAGTDYAWINRFESAQNLTFVLSPNAVLVNGNVALRGIERVHLQSGSGNDSLTAGTLADWLNGGQGHDSLKGMGGDDELTGWYGRDTLDGGDGHDTIWATGGIKDGDRDELLGGAGDDLVHMNLGDYANGGTGTDRVFLDLSEETAGVTLTFSAVRTTVGTTVFEGMESLLFDGTWGVDKVTGGAQSDILDGKAGNDVLRGGAGNDELSDGDGADKLSGEGGDDHLIRTDFDANGIDSFDGGAGIDQLSFNVVSNEGVILDLVEQEYNDGLAWGLTVRNIEKVIGSDRPDDIRGGAAAEVFWGGKQADYLEGRAGDDTLVGGQGGDILVGGDGKDAFFYGIDAIGSGDWIADFTAGEDKLMIDRAGFGLPDGYVLSLVTGTDPKPTLNGPQFLFETDTGRLWFDADGKGTDGDLQLVATLLETTTLTAGDFILV